MGQKTHPIGFRLGISKDWKSRYYAGRELPALLREDELLRKYLKARLGHAAIADIIIERKPGKVVVTLHTGRPGVVIGKKGAEVDKLRDELAHLTGKEVGINVEEIKRPELEAQLVAELIDFRSLLSDDDARTAGVDRDDDLARLPLDPDVGDRRMAEARLQVLAKKLVLAKELREVTVRVPLRSPGLGDAEPEPDRMCFLTH